MKPIFKLLFLLAPLCMTLNATALKKINANGDNIFGYLSYSDDYDQRVGLYELQDNELSLVWEDPVYQERYLAASSLCLDNGVLKGYAVDASYGGYVVFGIYYLEYNFETGENTTFERQELDYSTYMQCLALDEKENRFYGYGKFEDEPAFLSASVDDPFNYTLIATLSDTEEACRSLCINPTDNEIYGINSKYEFVKVEKDGTQSVLMNLDITDGGKYVSGLVFNPSSQVYYWNLIRDDESSAMAIIDPTANKLDIYATLTNDVQFRSLFTTDEMGDPLQPKRPVAGEASFPNGNLIGSVTFTLPSELFSGAKIEDAVNYETYVDDELYASGSGNAGDEIEAEFAVSQGMHSFGIKAKVNGFESTMATVKAYVGHDNPLAPENVYFSGSMASWDPSSPENIGIHGGYVDSKAISYKVSLNGEEIGTASETSMSIEIPEDAPLSLFEVEVIAECNGLASTPAYSNKVAAGAALELPQYIMPTPEEFELSTVVDNNNDDISWALQYDYDSDDYYIQTGFSAEGEKMDDWYFLPKMKFEDTSVFYSFSMQVALGDAFYNDEFVEVLLCSGPNPQNVLSTVINEFAPSSDTFQEVLGHLKVAQSGEYFIAIHCTSEGDQYGIKARNFYVENNNITENSPQAIESLNIVAGDKGALEAYVSFEMPTLRINGNEIPASTILKATVSCIDDVTVEGKPGEKVTAIVKTMQGDNLIKVVASDGEANSPVVTGMIFTGVNLPSPVAQLTYISAPDMMSMKLEWAPVVTGWISEENPDGGYIVPENITYDIYKSTGEEYDDYEFDEDMRGWMLYESDLTETSFTYTVDYGAPQEIAKFCIVPHNELGANYYVQSIASDIIGTPYSLPIVEDWDDYGEFNTDPWLTFDVPGASKSVYWGVWYTSDISEKYEDSETLSLVAQGDAGAAGRLATPRFTTMGCESATLSMNICGDFKLPIISILAQMYGEEAKEIGKISLLQDKKGFNKVSLDIPNEYLNKDWVNLLIQTEFEDDYEALVIEDLAIEKNSGVSVTEVSGRKIVVIADNNQIKISGLNGETIQISTLDGKLLAQKASTTTTESFNVGKGIYLVTAGHQTSKVIVK